MEGPEVSEYGRLWADHSVRRMRQHVRVKVTPQEEYVSKSRRVCDSDVWSERESSVIRSTICESDESDEEEDEDKEEADSTSSTAEVSEYTRLPAYPSVRNIGWHGRVKVIPQEEYFSDRRRVSDTDVWREMQSSVILSRICESEEEEDKDKEEEDSTSSTAEPDEKREREMQAGDGAEIRRCPQPRGTSPRFYSANVIHIVEAPPEKQVMCASQVTDPAEEGPDSSPRKPDENLEREMQAGDGPEIPICPQPRGTSPRSYSANSIHTVEEPLEKLVMCASPVNDPAEECPDSSPRKVEDWEKKPMPNDSLPQRRDHMESTAPVIVIPVVQAPQEEEEKTASCASCSCIRKMWRRMCRAFTRRSHVVCINELHTLILSSSGSSFWRWKKSKVAPI